MHPSLFRPVQLRLLGEFDVAVADVNATRAISYAKPKLLLALLALAQGKPHTRSELADMLWPDELRDGRANLRHALFVLRGLFKGVPDAWLGTNQTLALNPRVIMVDVLALTGAGGYEALSLEERLSYDRGRLLEYVDLPESAPFASWRTSWQSRVEREVSECRKTLLLRLQEEGRPGEATEQAKLWVQAHPDDERAHRHLIRLLLDGGNREAAVSAFENCVGLMRERYDTEPSAETRALLDTVLPRAEVRSAATPAPAQKQYRPLAVLVVTLSPDEPGLHPEQMLHGLEISRSHLLDLARKEGGHVLQGLAGNVVIVFGYPSLTERPSHASARLACAIRELSMPPGVKLGMGLHADIALVDADAGPDAGALVTQEAMRLAYLAEAGEILVSPAARGRLTDQFAARTEKRHGRELCILESQLDALAVHRMFGRVREFDSLVRMWARLQHAKPPTAMMMRGEQGVGKSLLARVMAEYVRRTGGEVCLLSCVEGYGETPFHPMRTYLMRRLSLEWGANDVADVPSGDLQSRAVDILCKRVGLDSAARPALKRVLFPEHDRTSSSDAPVVVDDASRGALVRALAAILAHHDDPRQPRLIIWEDLHWADYSSLALIEALMRTAQSAPMMLLTTAREEFARTWDAHDLPLRPLDRQAMAELVAHRSRGQRLAPRLRAQIVDSAEGIPLYAEEMVRHVSLGADIGVTPVIADLIASRLSALDPEARRLIQVAAVAGRLDDALLRRAADAHSDIPLLLGELHRRGLIDDAVPANFRHGLVRVAIYQTLNRTERRQYHEQVAQHLIGLDAGGAPREPAYVAFHLEQAADSKAAHWWILALRDALTQSALGEAEILAERALRTLGLIDDPAERRATELECQLLRGALFSALKGGGARETSLAYARTAELQQGDTNPSAQLRQFWGEWTIAMCTRPHAESLYIAERMYRQAEQAVDVVHLGWAQYACGYSRLWMGDVVSAERWMRACLQTFSAQPHHSSPFVCFGANGVCLARMNLGLALIQQGREEEGLASAKAGMDGADELGHLATRVLCLSTLARLHWHRGDQDAARQTAQRLAGLSEQTDFSLWRIFIQGWGNWARALEGEEDAIAHIESAARASVESIPLFQSSLELLLAQAHLVCDQIDEAMAAIERAGRAMDVFGTESVRGEYLRLLGDAWDKRGDGTRAIACWRRAVTESRRLGLSLSARKAEARIWAGDSCSA